MSGDKFWEQWSGGANPAGEKPAEPAPAAGGGNPSIDADALAAWLKSEPVPDPNPGAAPAAAPPSPVIAAPAPAPPISASAADLNALWPPAAPVDPFAGLQSSAPASTGADWDLGFDQPPTTPPAPPPPPATPASAVPGAPAGLNDFALEFGGALADPPASPAASPAGLPTAYSPPASPAETLVDQPAVPVLKITVNIGRRTVEQEVRNEALIGRPDTVRGLNPEIDLRQDDAVSRRHAKIFLKNGAYVLTDLNSTNGTRYNQQWLPAEQEVVLKAGDEIEVGELTLIRVVEAPQPHA